MWYTSLTDQGSGCGGFSLGGPYRLTQPNNLGVASKGPHSIIAPGAALVSGTGEFDRLGAFAMTEKTCTKCGKTKPLTAFGHVAKAKNGYSSTCRVCNVASIRAWRLANPEKWAETKRIHYRANCERIAAQHRAYYLAHLEETKAKMNEWRARNQYKVAGTKHAYYQGHVEQALESVRKYRLAHPEQLKDQGNRRRARQRGAFVESICKAKVYQRDRGVCHICGKKVDPKHWDLDHLMPISKGGEHSYRNVAVAHPSCNRRRQNVGPAQLRLMG